MFFSDVATSATNTWTDGAVVDAHVYEGWIYDYFFKRFGRRSIDDQDLELIGLVHPLARASAASYPPDIVGQWINNAAYLGDGFLLFGDGDGRVFDYLAGGFDVVVHEITHGVTEFTSGLIYQDEPGALNEAFSDIMAIAAEFFTLRAGQGPQRGPNFLIGEDVTKVAPGLHPVRAEPDRRRRPRPLFAAAVHRHAGRQRRRARQRARLSRMPSTWPWPAGATACPA